jgi:hypothetical protein
LTIADLRLTIGEAVSYQRSAISQENNAGCLLAKADR